MPRSRRPTVRVVALAAVLMVVLLGSCTSTVDGRGTNSRSPSAAPTATPSGSGDSSAADDPAQPPANFVDCTDRLNLAGVSIPAQRRARLTFACAQIPVPLDHARPGGRTIQLQLIKVHDRNNTARTGSLLVNPGGPGASGVETAVGLAARVSDDLLGHFDLIGFDPRGVGLSTPLRCLTDAQKDRLNAASPDVTTASGFAEAKADAKKFADACNNKYGSSLPYFNTVQTARDMESIRQAVRDPTMNFLGFSYGTQLGSVYSHLYPKSVRAVVLDGAVNPRTNGVTSFANQLDGFERSFDQFARYCTANASCRAIGDPRQAVHKIVKTAAKRPIPSNTAGETRKATTSLIYTGVLQALYSKSLWPTLGSAIESALDNNSAGLLSLADQYNQRVGGRYTNIADANTTIGCNDEKPGPSDATIRATAKSWAKRFPIFGSWSAPSLFGCQQWQPKRTRPPLPTAPATAQKVLVVGNVNDPATPYEGAKVLTTVLGNAELLTWDGEGHTSYLQGSSCIDEHVDRYLISGTLPPANTKCPS